jgi:hypothetical protein
LHRPYETCCGLSLWPELGAKELTQKFLKIKFAFGAIWRFRADASAKQCSSLRTANLGVEIARFLHRKFMPERASLESLR